MFPVLQTIYKGDKGRTNADFTSFSTDGESAMNWYGYEIYNTRNVKNTDNKDKVLIGVRSKINQ